MTENAGLKKRRKFLTMKNIFRTKKNRAGTIMLEGLEKFEKGELRAAVESFTKALEIDPENIKALFCRANAYVSLRKRKRAIDDYTKIISIDPRNSSAFHHRGKAYRQKKMYDKAVSDYSREIALDPENPAAYNSRGFCLCIQKDHKKAVDDFTKALELDSGFAIAHYNRGVCLRLMGLYDKAIKDFEKYQLLQPDGKYSQKILEIVLSDRVKSSNQTNCPSCTAEITISAHFCSGCGFNLKQYLHEG